MNPAFRWWCQDAPQRAGRLRFGLRDCGESLSIRAAAADGCWNGYCQRMMKSTQRLVGASWVGVLGRGVRAACFLVVVGGLGAWAGEVRITDFGAQPDSRRNAVTAVQKALEACRKADHPVLVFPAGRYDFWPQGCVEKDYFESNTTANNPKRLGILIEKMSGVTIDGGGSTFVFHDRMQPFTVEH